MDPEALVVTVLYFHLDRRTTGPETEIIEINTSIKCHHLNQEDNVCKSIFTFV